MAVRNVVLYPNKPLTSKAVPYETVGPEVLPLVRDMFDTMDANDGVGLAGPQVGVSKRILVLAEPESKNRICLINPEILDPEGAETAEEGCLSLPQVYAPVTRYDKIRVRALNEHGEELEFEATGLLARIVQHETDHLDGLIFLDRVDLLTREAKLQEWKEVHESMTAAVGSRAARSC